MKAPSIKGHLIISLIKSAIRIIGFIAMPFDIYIAATLLILAEGLGVLEELV